MIISFLEISLAAKARHKFHDIEEISMYTYLIHATLGPCTKCTCVALVLKPACAAPRWRSPQPALQVNLINSFLSTVLVGEFPFCVAMVLQ
jgi:hypothetical protein